MPVRRTSDSDLIERIVAEVQSTLPESRSAERVELLRKGLSRLLDDSSYSAQSPERLPVTVLVAELRGFDAVAEQQPAITVINLFNRFLSGMTAVVARHNGVMQKCNGHVLLVSFSAARGEDHATQALACAAEMQQAMSRFNQQSEVLQLPSLFLGIGVDSGNAVTGGSGAGLQRDYTVVGQVVSVASRIAAQSLRGQVLLSDATYRLVHDFVLVGGSNSLRVRNRRIPINVYELLGTTRPRALSIPRRDVRKSPRVLVQMPCYFQKVRASSALGPLHCGQVLDVGYRGIRMISPVQLETYSEVKMVLSLQLLGSRTSDIFARVVRADPDQHGYCCSMEFTDIDMAGRQTIKQFVDSQVCAA